MCLALRASGLWLRYATLQNLIPSFPWIAPPRPPPWRNPRKGRDQILPSGNLGLTANVIIPDLSTKSAVSTPEMGLVTQRMRKRRRRGTTPLPDFAGLFGRRSGNWQGNSTSESPRLFGRRSEILRDHNSTDREAKKQACFEVLRMHISTG